MRFRTTAPPGRRPGAASRPIDSNRARDRDERDVVRDPSRAVLALPIGPHLHCFLQELHHVPVPETTSGRPSRAAFAATHQNAEAIPLLHGGTGNATSTG